MCALASSETNSPWKRTNMLSEQTAATGLSPNASPYENLSFSSTFSDSNPRSNNRWEWRQLCASVGRVGVMRSSNRPFEMRNFVSAMNLGDPPSAVSRDSSMSVKPGFVGFVKLRVCGVKLPQIFIRWRLWTNMSFLQICWTDPSIVYFKPMCDGSLLVLFKAQLSFFLSVILF